MPLYERMCDDAYWGAESALARPHISLVAGTIDNYVDKRSGSRHAFIAGLHHELSDGYSVDPVPAGRALPAVPYREDALLQVITDVRERRRTHSAMLAVTRARLGGEEFETQAAEMASNPLYTGEPAIIEMSPDEAGTIDVFARIATYFQASTSKRQLAGVEASVIKGGGWARNSFERLMVVGETYRLRRNYLGKVVAANIVKPGSLKAPAPSPVIEKAAQPIRTALKPRLA